MKNAVDTTLQKLKTMVDRRQGSEKTVGKALREAGLPKAAEMVEYGDWHGASLLLKLR